LAWRSWKEALIILLLATILSWLWMHDRQFLRELAARRINQSILLYALLHLVLAAITDVNPEAVLYALVYNLRFFGIFLLAQIVWHYFRQNKTNERQLIRIVLWPAVIVVAFGLLQATILPKDFLANFGYGPETIEPFTTIDDKANWLRFASFTRGPNQLGQYLLLPLLLAVALWWNRSTPKLTAFLAGGGAAMIATFSRSAWLGLAVATGAYFTIFNPQFSFRKFSKRIVITVMAAVVVVCGVLAWATSSESLRLVIFHDDQAVGDAAGADEVRTSQTRQSLELIGEQPLGHGPGAAGPASFHNDTTRINDNYYLQLALEVGVIGLIIFLTINYSVARSLWRQRQELWPRVLLAVFAGMALINLFLSGWAQDEISLMWWGLAGLVYRE
jgi:hypothetical protein